MLHTMHDSWHILAYFGCGDLQRQPFKIHNHLHGMDPGLAQWKRQACGPSRLGLGKGKDGKGWERMGKEQKFWIFFPDLHSLQQRNLR